MKSIISSYKMFLVIIVIIEYSLMHLYFQVQVILLNVSKDV